MHCCRRSTTTGTACMHGCVAGVCATLFQARGMCFVPPGCRAVDVSRAVQGPVGGPPKQLLPKHAACEAEHCFVGRR